MHHIHLFSHSLIFWKAPVISSKKQDLLKSNTEFMSNYFFGSFVWGVWTPGIFNKPKAITARQLHTFKGNNVAERRTWFHPSSVCCSLQQPPSRDLPAPSFQTGIFRFRCEQRHTVNSLSKQEINTRLPSDAASISVSPVLPWSEQTRDLNPLLVAAALVRPQPKAVCSKGPQTKGSENISIWKAPVNVCRKQQKHISQEHQSLCSL